MINGNNGSALFSIYDKAGNTLFPQTYMDQLPGSSYNGGGDKDTDVEVDTAPAKTAAPDLDVVTQKRSAIKAAPEAPKKYGTKATLGRDRQK
jgi:hypothetical protein